MSENPNSTAVAKPVEIVRHSLERMKPQLAMALPKHLAPERLIRIAMTAVQRTPKLLECDRTSFYGAVMTAAQLGLEPDGVLGQAYLIPFGGKVQFIPGYRGLITLARNSGEVSYIAAHEVREQDKFEFDFASGDPPAHTFDVRQPRGEVIAFYAIARFKDGSFYWDMLTTAEVDQIRDSSSGYQSAKRYAKNGKIDSPWTDHYVEMGKKTAIRRIAKYLPLSVQKAAEIDAAVSSGLHVTLDRYGDVVIDGDAVEQVGEPAAVVAQSQLERFEAAHSEPVVQPAEPSVEHSAEPAEDAFGLSPLQQQPRSTLWSQKSYRVDPSKDLTGDADWQKWASDLVFLVGEADAAEIEKLKADNKDYLSMLRRSEASDGYREFTEAVAARLASLSTPAAA